MTEVQAFDLESYLAKGVENVVRELVRGAAFHPAESAFMARYALAGRKAARLRRESAARGGHVPPFLICSITSKCNLHCAGCYARALESVDDNEPARQLSAEDWGSVFAQARELGVSFILLAGGEPLARRDVIEEAARCPEIFFPIFTNGTLLDDEYLELLEKHRNLAPVVSIEGGEGSTDRRRGQGVYGRVRRAMGRMREKRIAFGASVTVTSENLEEVTAPDFVRALADEGCKGVVYVEFVPTAHELRSLALSEMQQGRLAENIRALREGGEELLLISFPGDEKSSGGCLAAGRGFFHINSHGGAEPCPFSPYSDLNVRECGLRGALDSGLFRALRSGELLRDEHLGGCVLYEKRAQVEALLEAQKED